MGTAITAVRAANFTASIGVNTHMAYTDGAYANVGNVMADLAYIGVSRVRDGVPNSNGGVPTYNQLQAYEAMGAAGIKFDLIASPNGLSMAQSERQLIALDSTMSNAIVAIEGPNEINNWPVTYNGLTGTAAATAYQTAIYSAIKGNAATAGIQVYNFTGALQPVLLGGGSYVRNTNGSYTLTSGQLGFHVTLPTGISTITMTYTSTGSSTPSSGLFGYPAQNEQSACYGGSNGVIKYTYNNTSGAAKTVYADFINYGDTSTITNVTVTGPGSSTNLVTFDPNLSLAGQANDANVHIYGNAGAALGPSIANSYLASYGSAAPGPRVITETGYNTDPNDFNGVSQTVQAQQIVNGLLEAYKDGVSATYLYELLDEKPDPNNTNSEMHFGLFNNNNTPKLAAVALHNLTGMLADTGAKAASFATGTLNYTATGANAADQSELFEKSSGEFDIALWNDNFAGGSATDSVTLNLGASFKNVAVYDVLTGAETSYSNVSQITVTLGGDPLLVKINSAAVAAAAGLTFLQPAGAAAVTATASVWSPAVPVAAVASSGSAIAVAPTPAPLAAAIAQSPTSLSAGLVTHAAHHF